jgi:hypothetical protein
MIRLLVKNYTRENSDCWFFEHHKISYSLFKHH